MPLTSDGSPILATIEPYRKTILAEVLDTWEGDRVRYNLALLGRGKKNAKSLDLVLAALFACLANDSIHGNECYIVATILPGQDVAGTHGRTYRFCGLDEIHTQRDWSLLEALALDPTRPDAQLWITSYASIYHKAGAPLFDLLAQAKRGDDPRMYCSWYAADWCTDPSVLALDPESRARAIIAAAEADESNFSVASGKERGLGLALAREGSG
jgi:hypothetical protein